jgi:hypothetical protein
MVGGRWMTLILTEVTPLGIVMAADSAYTRVDGSVRPGEKLFLIPGLNAGLSLWGRGLPVKAEDWVRGFISTHSQSRNLGEFVEALRDELRQVSPPLLPDAKGEGTIGFHIAAYEGQDRPSVFHVHNGISTSLAARGEWVEPNLVNANHDLPPDVGQLCVHRLGTSFVLRNGDYKPFAVIWYQAGAWAETFLASIMEHARSIPELEDRALFLASQIEMMRVLYMGMGQQRFRGTESTTIGGPVRYLTIRNPGVASPVRTAAFSQSDLPSA